MKKGVYAENAITCNFCQERTTQLCARCRKPCCGKHAVEAGGGIACKDCSAGGNLFRTHAAVVPTPLWWDILFFKFDMKSGGYKVVEREQFHRFRIPLQTAVESRGAILNRSYEATEPDRFWQDKHGHYSVMGNEVAA